jgi:RHS repeat-associated protein
MGAACSVRPAAFGAAGAARGSSRLSAVLVVVALVWAWVAFFPAVSGATTVKGADSQWGALEFVPDTDPGVADAQSVNAGPKTVAFVQSMPVTKLVRRVTVGDVASSPECSGAAQVRLFVHRYATGTWSPPGGSGSVEVVRSGVVSLPSTLSQVGFDVPAFTAEKGNAYAFSLHYAAGCSTVSLRSWAHNGATVNSGSERCAAVPEIVDGPMSGFPKRMWHESGLSDYSTACIGPPYAPPYFDANMPTGWLVTYDAGSRQVMRGATRGALSPSLCGFPYFAGSTARGVEAALWYEVPEANGQVLRHYVCRFTQYAPPSATVANGWYFGSPWLGSRQGKPRDTYLGLNAYEPTRPEYFGLGALGVSDYSAAPNRPDCYKGDPVNCATGNFAEGFTDLSVPVRGVGLKFARTYNSQAAEVAASPGPLGYGWSHAFGEKLAVAGNGVVTVTHDDGSTATFTPTTGGAYSAAGWIQSKLVKRADGTYVYTLSDRRVLSFTTAGVLEWVEDRNGNRTTLTYASGRLTAITDPAGRAISVSYNGDGRISQVSDPAGHAVQFAYTAGELTSATDAEGGVTEFGYDAHHRITSVIDPRGKEMTNSYDAQGRVVTQTDALNRTIAWDWSTPDETRITNPDGKVTVQRFRSMLPVSITKAAGTADEATWTYDYDINGNPISRTNPAGKTWRYTYDAKGNRLTETDPLDHTTEYTYDSDRNLTKVKTPAGRETSFTYDAKGNLLTVKRTHTESGQLAQSTFDYDANGLLESVTDPLNRVSTFAYNARGDLTATTTPEGHTATATYDIAGRQSSVTSARGNAPGADPADFTTTYTRNAFGQATDIEDPLGRHTLLEYNANQQLTKLTDPAGEHTVFTYDAAGQQTNLTRPDLSELQTAYTSTGLMASQTDGKGKTTTYDYDGQGRLKSVTDPLNRTRTLAYNNAGQLATLTDAASRTTSYSYNAAGRLTATTYSSGDPGAVSTTYNADGDPLTVTDQTGTTTYDYDSLGRLKSHESGAGQKTSYGYDLAGQVTSIGYPEALTLYDTVTQDPQQQIDTGTVTRAYDDDGRLASVTDWLNNQTTFTYNPDGQLTGVARPNGTSASYDHDAVGALVDLEDLGAATALGRDSRSLLSSATPSGSTGTTFGYDELSRLTSAGSATYAYDDADNLTQTVSPAGQAITQAFDDANQLVSSSQDATVTATFGYDVHGNRASRTSSGAGNIDYDYDQAGQLTSYDGPNQAAIGTVEEHYSYDASGLRQTRTSAGKRRNYAYDLSGGLPTIITDGPTAYITGPDGLPIEQITQDGTVRHFHHDQLGSTTALSDDTGTTVATYTYDAYGNPTGTPPTVENPFRYAGQYTDTATGLQYLRARYYDPATGQFITRDPLETQTRQPYAYANNSPTNYTDPTGLISFNDISEAAAGALDAASFGFSTKLAGAAFGFDADCAEWGPGFAIGQGGGTVIGAVNPVGALGAIVKTGARGAAKGPGAPFPTRPVRPDKIHGLEDALARARKGENRISPDGKIFENRYGNLPEGRYTEWDVPTPGVAGPGKRRLVFNKDTGEAFYTWNHYNDFVPVRTRP